MLPKYGIIYISQLDTLIQNSRNGMPWKKLITMKYRLLKLTELNRLKTNMT